MIPNPNPNLGHFCDPDANAYPTDKDITALDLVSRIWTKVRVQHPIHNACSGKTIINFALENEQIVDCECPCHKGDSQK